MEYHQPGAVPVQPVPIPARERSRWPLGRGALPTQGRRTLRGRADAVGVRRITAGVSACAAMRWGGYSRRAA